MFGADAVRTAIVLMREGADGIREPTGSSADASASDEAAAWMDGLNGTTKELRPAFEELQLVIADSGLLETFTNIVEATANLARALGDLDGDENWDGPEIKTVEEREWVAFNAMLGETATTMAGIAALAQVFGFRRRCSVPEFPDYAEQCDDYETG